MLDSNPDDTFARTLQDMGAVTFEQLQDAREAQSQKAQGGQDISLAEVLIGKGVITELMRENIEKKLAAQKAGGIKQLGAYKLIKKIGEGGMGSVYLAEDTQVGRPCALKVLQREYATSPEFLSRFRREAIATGKLNHPNIVMAYTVGEDLGIHYYAMEYCDGVPLDDVLDQGGRIPWPVMIDVMIQVSKGLEHAHEHGIIHRDIKPANIFICRPPGTQERDTPFPKGFVAKILDLGLSKSLTTDAESSFLTQTGVTLGTPHYIAPEQAEGEKQIDGRADVYSLGATFYHLLTGKTPFLGSTAAAVIMAHLRQPVPDPRKVNPNIPESVSKIILRMLAKNPADRYPSCTELLQDLERALANPSPVTANVQAQPGPSANPAVQVAEQPQPAPVVAPVVEVLPTKPSSINLWMVAGAALAFIVLLTLFIQLLIPDAPPEKTLEQKLAAARKLGEERQKAEAARAEAERAKRKSQRLAQEAAARKAAEKKKAEEDARLKALQEELAEKQRLAEAAQRKLKEAKRRAAEGKHRPVEPDPATKDVVKQPGDDPGRKPPDEPKKEPVGEDPDLIIIQRWANVVLHERNSIECPSLKKVYNVEHVEGLKQTREVLIRRVFEAEDALRRAQNNETAAKNKIAVIERRLEASDPFNRPAPRPRPGGRPPPPVHHRPDRLHADRERDMKHLDTLKSQAGDAHREVLRVERAVQLLSTAKQVVTDRLRVLGVQDLASPPAETHQPAAYKVYVLKDGTELKAYMVVKMGDQVAIKDENGEMHTIPKSNIKEIRNGP